MKGVPGVMQLESKESGLIASPFLMASARACHNRLPACSFDPMTSMQSSGKFSKLVNMCVSTVGLGTLKIDMVSSSEVVDWHLSDICRGGHIPLQHLWLI